MAYREPLPLDCPPDDAVEIAGRRVVYRLVRHNPPVDDDFRSQRAERPDAMFREVTECQARGLSVFSGSSHALRRAKSGKLKGAMLCEVTLDRGSGRIRRTGNRSGHQTWWPLADFDILANCRVVRL